jgi:hypothetical protein
MFLKRTKTKNTQILMSDRVEFSGSLAGQNTKARPLTTHHSNREEADGSVDLHACWSTAYDDTTRASDRGWGWWTKAKHVLLQL